MTGPRVEIHCQRWLDEMSASIPVAREGRDPEGVHRLRIAVARLRVWLMLAGVRVYQDDLRWLRDRAAAVRDLDVHLLRRPPAPVARALRRKRAAARRQLLATLGHPRLESLSAGLAAMPSIPRDRAERETARLARDVLARGRAMSKHRADADASHALRIGARRFRFALDWIGEDSTAIERLQDALGELGDRQIALRHLASIGRRGRRVRKYRSKLEREIDRAAERAMRIWKRTRPLVEDWSRWNFS